MLNKVLDSPISKQTSITGLASVVAIGTTLNFVIPAIWWGRLPKK